MSKKYELDIEEKTLEEQYESLKPAKDKQKLVGDLTHAARRHVQNKKPITIRLSVQDLEAIKIKASRCGLPYQTYLNMLIHKDATSL